LFLADLAEPVHPIIQAGSHTPLPLQQGACYAPGDTIT